MDDFNSRDNFNDSTRAFVKVDSDVEEIERQDESYTPDIHGQHTSSYDGPIITSDQAAEARRGLENLQGMNLAPEILAAASAKLTGVLGNYQAQRNAAQGERDFEHTSLGEAYGGMTAADLQLRRLQGDSPSDMTGYSMGTRMAIKDLTSDQFRGMNTYGVASIAELDAIRARAGSAMEISPHEFSQGLNIDASQTAQKVTTKSGWTSKEAQHYGRNEVIQAVKFLEGVGTNLDVGPGGRLNLHSGNEETDKKQLTEMEWAIDYTARFADKLIHQDTKDSSIYGVRKEATQQAVLNRMLEGKRYNKPTKDGKYFMFDEKNQLPAPLDLGVPGLIDNLSMGGFVNGEFVGGSEFSQREYQQAVLSGSHSEEYLAVAEPNVARSLWPKPAGIKKGSPEETAYYQERRAAHEQEKEDWKRASAILNAQMTTNQNETNVQSRGKRWTGYDVDPEQEKRNALYEEAAMLDIDMVGHDVEAKVMTREIEVLSKTGVKTRRTLTMKGSDNSGMYEGGEDRSDRDDFIEAGMEYDPVKSFVGPMPIKQGTDAWKAQRKGNITASVIGNTTEELAIQLANERLGNSEEFLSSGHVKEGNLYEDNVGRSFMHEHGERLGLTMKEAFFETNADLPGFGVSPDANLYDKDGNRSLLELKYLASDGSMDKSMKTYKEQLQLQMAVTGAKEVHFYRQNKRTGGSAYDLIKADPEQQAELIKRGQDAQELASTLDAIGVDDLKKKLASRPERAAAKEAGPATVMKTEEKAQAAKATVMDLSKVSTNMLSDAISSANSSVSFGDASGATEISEKEFGERLQREENINKLAENAAAIAADKAIVDSAKTPASEPMSASPLSTAISQANSGGHSFGGISKKEFGKRVKREEDMKSLAENSSAIAADKAMEDAESAREASKAMEDMARATNEASANMKKLGGAVLKVVGAVAGIALSGNDSEMTNQRIASETGMDAQRVEGIREELQAGGVTEADTGSAMMQFGALSKEAADPLGASGMTSRINKAMLLNPKLRHLNLPNQQTFEGLSGEGFAEMVTGQVNQLTDPTAKRDLLAIYGQGKLAPAFDANNANRVTQDDVASVRGDINSKQRFDFNAGVEKAAIKIKNTKEDVASGGEAAGATAKTVNDVVVPAGNMVGDLATAAVAGYTAVKGVTAVSASATLSSGIAAAATSTAAVTGAAIVAAGAVGYGAGTVLNKTLIEGTAVGDSIGSGIAHTLAFLGNDEAQASVDRMDAADAMLNPPAATTVPSKNLGSSSSSSSQTSSSAGTSLNSNVTVNVEVSEDGVKTKVNDNGKKYMDENTTYSQD